MADPNKPKKDDLNTPTNAERAYDVGSFIAKTTATVLAPIGGGVLAAGYDLFVKNPATKRTNNFLVDLDQRVTEMEAAGLISVKDLENNEVISSLLLQAIQTATRSSGEKKIEALKEIVIKGITSKEAASAFEAQVMLTLADRMTEHHIIALHWKSIRPHGYGLEDFENDSSGNARKVLHYGQPVFENANELIDPVIIYKSQIIGRAPFFLYVEKSSKIAFEFAEQELTSLGLTERVYRTENYREDRKIKQRTTNDIVDVKLSSRGKYFLEYAGIAKIDKKITLKKSGSKE